MADDTTDETPSRPVLRVVSGSPTPEDLAVLSVLAAAASGGDGEPAPRVRRGGWSDPNALHRREIVPGPNAWRSALR